MENNWSYQILRPCMWFATGDYIPVAKFAEYFTPHAIKSLLKDGFIKVHSDE